jgi:hypothetical protein
MHLFVSLVYKEVQEFAADFRTGQHGRVILNDQRPSASLTEERM